MYGERPQLVRGNDCNGHNNNCVTDPPRWFCEFVNFVHFDISTNWAEGWYFKGRHTSGREW